MTSWPSHLILYVRNITLLLSVCASTSEYNNEFSGEPRGGEGEGEGRRAQIVVITGEEGTDNGDNEGVGVHR